MEDRGILQQQTPRKTKPAVQTKPATPKPAPAGRQEYFTLDAPRAQHVYLLGDFTHWEQSPVELQRQKGGPWRTTVTLQPGTYEYRFKVDGQWFDDPACAQRRTNAFGGVNCVREVR